MKKIYLSVALACFVFFLSCVQLQKLGPRPPEKTAELLGLGKKLYADNCIQCHGPNGDGKGWKAAELKVKPRDFTLPYDRWTYSQGDPQKIFEVLKKGIPDTPMAMFHFSDEERWALVYRVMEFSKEDRQ